MERAIGERNGELAYIALEIKIGALGHFTEPRLSELLRREGIIS
jgi:hypothetical protein